MRSRASSYRYVVSRPRCARWCGQPTEACGFQVAWSINPHMLVGSVQTRHAVRQHATFVRALESAGAHIELVPFVHGAFDSVFSKDNAVVVQREHGGTEALLAAPRHAQRRLEQRARAEALSSLGVRVWGSPRAPLEGGDVVVLPGARGAFLGHGFRSSTRAACDLERFLDADVTCLELHDAHLYHLDMVLTVLDDGTALVCEEALTAPSRKALRSHPEIRSIVHVPLSEARRFGVNLVQVGNTVVWGADAPETTRALEALGHEVHRVDLDQFHRAGGSAACLVSRVHRQDAASVEVFEEAPHSTAA